MIRSTTSQDTSKIFSMCGFLLPHWNINSPVFRMDSSYQEKKIVCHAFLWVVISAVSVDQMASK